MSKHICMGVLAHVDAGKTTLSEAFLYESGSIRRAGRVDDGDAFLDTDALEKKRGITIFSKQAEFSCGDTQITLLDTPGHADFSAEMERTLAVLDYAVLVVSAADGVEGQTRTLWRLLDAYGIPAFVFVNKMDQTGAEKEALMRTLRTRLSDGCVDFSDTASESFREAVAMTDERALERYLQGKAADDDDLRRLIAERVVFPCFFGSALRLWGVAELLDGIGRYAMQPDYGDEFGMRVFKIARDSAGERLTFAKITGGTLKVKTALSGVRGVRSDEPWEEKVNQIRVYSGTRYELLGEARAGTVCALTGLSRTAAGEGFGAEKEGLAPLLTPVLTYALLLPDGMDAAEALPKLRALEEEEPQFHFSWSEKLREIHVRLMGEVQLEILKSRVRERYGFDVSFGAGRIVYKETIADTVEGVGHFEPLRHYAEVHLLLEPGEAGSGLEFAADCSTDELDKNWQKLILTHLREREHRGVLTGSAVTDLKITVIGGRAHKKHTEGGDFRQAAYRAVRQGLKQAQSVLLEPYYEFFLTVPQENVGRAMADLERMSAKFGAPSKEGEFFSLHGLAPAACIANYQKDAAAYTRGRGNLVLAVAGYYPCHNADEVIAEIGYDSERDAGNPTGSVFCAHGAGFVVPWDEVADYMHVPGRLLTGKGAKGETAAKKKREKGESGRLLGTDEIDAILERTYHANRRGAGKVKRWRTAKKVISADGAKPYAGKTAPKEHYLLVDGYNIIFAWEELRELAKETIDGARGRLLDILCNYRGAKQCDVIAVFDAYRVKGHNAEFFDYHDIHVVYTKEAETADAYIEKFAHEHGRSADVWVATSDGLEQIIITGEGCRLISAREFEREVKETEAALRERIGTLHE